MSTQLKNWVASYNNCVDNNEEALTSQGTKRKILVVDDEPDIALTLKAGLEDIGLFSVETFNDQNWLWRDLSPTFML